MPRPEQMNINVATWGRLLKKNINLAKSDLGPEARQEQENFAGEYLSNGFKLVIKVVLCV